MLKGQYVAKIDKSGRLRLPSTLRKSIEEEYGREVFMTSLDDEGVQIFPVSEWENLTFARHERGLRNSEVRTFFLKANRWGVRREIDRWGRILIQKELRDKTSLKDNAVIEGRKNHLILKNFSSCD